MNLLGTVKSVSLDSVVMVDRKGKETTLLLGDFLLTAGDIVHIRYKEYSNGTFITAVKDLTETDTFTDEEGRFWRDLAAKAAEKAGTDLERGE